MRDADQPAKPHTRRSSPVEPYKPRQAGPMLSQPAFDWKAPEMYLEPLKFGTEVPNILQLKVCDRKDEEKVPAIKTCSDREGLHFIQTH